MSVTRKTGEMRRVTHTTSLNTEYQYTWLVRGFTNCYNASGIAYPHESHPVYIGPNCEYEWTLDMYAAGFNRKRADYVGMCPYLRNEERHKDTKFTVELSVLDQNDKKQYTRKVTLTHENFNVSDGIFEDFVLRRDLWNQPGLMPNDELKFVWKIWIGEPTTIKEVGKLKCTPSYSEEVLKKLYDNKQFGDFKLIVGRKEFCVHRAILAATSPVFQAMFESKMRETSEGKVHIEDVEAAVIEKALYFIYVGELKDRDHLVDKVLAVAEKYQLDSLKQLCENELVKQLKVDNIYDTLLLADENNAEELKKQAINYFLKNAKKLFVAKMDFKNSISILPPNLLTDIIYTFVSQL